VKLIGLFALSAVLTLSACGSKPDNTSSSTASTTTAPEAQVASADVQPASFGQCAVCHKVAKDGGNGVGPNLHGVIGKKAGIVEGYSYSDALKSSGLVWDEATLEKYIENTRGTVPGTKMVYAGQKDPAKRKEIIAWLKKNS
jgi:cytochrome c